MAVFRHRRRVFPFRRSCLATSTRAFQRCAHPAVCARMPTCARPYTRLLRTAALQVSRRRRSAFKCQHHDKPNVAAVKTQMLPDQASEQCTRVRSSPRAITISVSQSVSQFYSTSLQIGYEPCFLNSQSTALVAVLAALKARLQHCFLCLWDRHGACTHIQCMITSERLQNNARECDRRRGP